MGFLVQCGASEGGESLTIHPKVLLVHGGKILFYKTIATEEVNRFIHTQIFWKLSENGG